MPLDYSGQNLRGHSFKGQNLEGANFSYADIRSANFTNAKLNGANFSHATAGLQKRWIVFLILVSCLLSGISGFLWVSNLVLGSLIFDTSNFTNQITGWMSLIVFTLIMLFFITIRQELIALGVVIIAFATSIGIAVIGAIIVGVIFGNRVGVLAVTSAVSFAGAVAVAFSVTGAITIFVAAAIAIAGNKAGCVAGCVAVAIKGVFVGFGCSAGVILSVYMAWRAMKGDKKYSLVRNIAIAFAAIGGTNFRNADLTDANFTEATLKSTDLRNATLNRTCFAKTKLLNRVRPGNTYLQNAQLRELLITRQGQDKNLDRLDLRGVNLQEAILTDASFIGADLSEANLQGAILTDASFIGANLSKANLQDADLSRAKLVKAQLDATDFTGATLTGAYIEDWGITSDTKFDGVRCEYVYMRLPTKEHPDPLRKPDNNKEVFADGEFGDFIKPIVDTLDLYHNQGVDPRAIAISFKQLAENHPEADLRIVGMEVRGEDKFLLRAKTADSANKSELSAEYFTTYNQLKGLPDREIRSLLAEKDSRIRSLETMVMTALERPSFYSSTQIQEVSSMTSNPGGFSIGGSVGGNVNNVQGDNNRAVQGDNNQAVLGDGNQVTQQNQVGATAETTLTKDDIIKLFAELEALIKKAELPADTKEEVIEDLSAAKNATDKEEPNKERALKKLTDVTEALENTSKSVEAGQKIWTTAKPIIMKVASWLGAAAGSYLLGL
ncbi:pentapeptide repeat-containing protein [Anabaena azotica]|uniref:pentapeptide repeat-containing protein n=1 Tax=Anabaena azotica TaxID=197653 RepID=UPI0039A4B564